MRHESWDAQAFLKASRYDSFQNKGTQFIPQYSIVLTIGTFKKVPLIWAKPPYTKILGGMAISSKQGFIIPYS